ncbi:ketopantoate reductase family protein [Sinomonas atrocyanea]|uniref:ketopantoate reductase family protein n=1 Tax=Sinomonas atrocyanea TaxID=37927 RepID=UPI003D95B00E
MRIAVIGAGAIGATLAALLDGAGHIVEATARGERLAAMRADGIRLSGAWGEHVARVAVKERLATRPDLALLCVKAQDEEEAIRANAAHLDGVPLVVVQNGLDGVVRAESVRHGAGTPGAPTVGAIAFFSADCPAAGEVRVLVPGPLYLGAGDGEPSPDAVAAARTLADAIPAHAVRNFAGCQWTKLVVNQINAMPAVTGMSVQATLGDRTLRAVVLESIREAVRVGRKQGLAFGSLEGVTPLTLAVLGSAPRAVGRVLLGIMARRLGTEPVLGSTLQSVQRGAPTEIDHLNGAVVERARAVGVEAPVNAALTELVHEVERTRRFFTPAEVAARIG